MGWWGGGGVDTNALPSSSPSLIWLSWGFGLAWAVTISTHEVNLTCRVYLATDLISIIIIIYMIY